VSTVYTGGTFDLFHAGHVNFLRKCKEIAQTKHDEGYVVVSLNSDEFIKKYKGKPPVINFDDRFEVLSACRYVDSVMVNYGGADSKPAIEEMQPDIIAIGSDWAKKDYYKQMQFTQDWLDERDISLVYIPYTQGISSTEIKKRL
jgi:glycerol-3-phosphate cytidylyltransferase